MLIAQADIFLKIVIAKPFFHVLEYRTSKENYDSNS